MNATLYAQGLGTLVAVVGAVIVAGYAFRRRAAIGAAFLGTAMAASAAWGLCSLLVRWLPSLPATAWLEVTRYLCAAVIPVAWYSLVISLASMGRRPSSSAVARLSVIPVITSLLAVGSAQHRLLWTAQGTPGLWLWVYVGYSLGLVVAGWAILLRDGQAIRAWRREALWMLMGAGPLVGVASMMGLWAASGWASTLVQLATAGGGILLLQMLYLQPAQEISALSAQALGAEADDAVLALDARNRVMDANAPALLLLAEYGVWQAVGRPADKVLTGPLAPLASVSTDDAITLSFPGGARTVRSRELPLGSTPWGGRALLFQDVAHKAPCAVVDRSDTCTDVVTSEQMQVS